MEAVGAGTGVYRNRVRRDLDRTDALEWEGLSRDLIAVTEGIGRELPVVESQHWSRVVARYSFRAGHVMRGFSAAESILPGDVPAASPE